VGESAGPLVHASKLRKIDLVFDALRAEKERGSTSPYELRVAAGVLGAEVVSVIQSAGFAGFGDALFEVEGKKLTLHARIPGLPGAAPPPWEVRFPEDVLMLAVRGEIVEIWRIPKQGTSGNPRAVATVKSADVPTGVSAALARECSVAMRCSPMALALEADADFGLAARALAAASRASGGGPQAAPSNTTGPSEFDALVLPKFPAAIGQPPVMKVAMGQPPVIRLERVEVSGPLAPEVIQRVFREQYQRFHACYDDGLKRNPKLEGRVVPKFVIERDGSVRDVTMAASTLPDAMVQCLQHACETLRFPPPDGGIVTVVYPMAFSPGGVGAP
jgi:hypothetical protein